MQRYAVPATTAEWLRCPDAEASIVTGYIITGRVAGHRPTVVVHLISSGSTNRIGMWAIVALIASVSVTRASAAPRQWCAPPPKVSNSGLAAVMKRRGRNSSASDQTAGSRCAVSVHSTKSDPATFGIVRSKGEVRSGDRLMPSVEQELEQAYQPHAPAADVAGRIIAVVNGVSRIGQGNIVVLNLGTQQGIETGHVLAVYQAGKQVSDPYSKTRSGSVKLPDERTGAVMVFRTFERVSYALVMQAKGPMHRYDAVKNP